jgi:hypothetical protein
MTSPLLYFAAVLFPFFALAQKGVPANNSIEKPVMLVEEAPNISVTNKDCDVQWKCVSHRSLNQRIEFHNDIWFTFVPESAGTYFVSVQSQICRKGDGIQMVLFKGVPCDTPTYRYKKGLFKNGLNDLYIEFTDLEKGRLYYLQVDGYAGDICSFSIGLTRTRPNTAVEIPANETPVSMVTSNGVVTYHWEISKEQADSITGFSIHRTRLNSFYYEQKGNVPVKFNTVREAELKYSFDDVFEHPGSYFVQLIMHTSSGNKYLLRKWKQSYYDQKNERKNHYFSFHSEERKKTEYEIKIMNRDDGRVLQVKLFETVKGQVMIFPLLKFVNQGVNSFSIEVKGKNKIRRFEYSALDQQTREL